MASVTRLTNGTVMLTGTNQVPATPLLQDPPYHLMPLSEIIDSLPTADRWAIDSFQTSDNGQALAMAIITGQATAVSDGSYKSSLGTSAFILRGAQRKLGFMGTNVVPGNPEDHSSYRSELAGISGILAVTSCICKKYSVDEGQITVALDGEQALLKASSLWPLSPTDTDFDLLSDIRRKIEKLPIKINWHWIEGHQDDDTPYHLLPPLAKDNVLADGLAKNRLNQCLVNNYTLGPQRFGDEGWSISLEGRKLPSLDYRKLYRHMWAHKAIDYWAGKHNREYEIILSIDWDVCGEAISSLTFPQRRRAVKQASGHFGIGTKMLQWGFQDHDHCPMCQQCETPAHVLWCKDERATTTWNHALDKLESWLRNKNTDPEIQLAILSNLRAWHEDTNITAHGHNSQAEVLISQDSIGWYPFILGHISQQWQHAQQAWFTKNHKANTGRQWAKQLILQLLKIQSVMWQHRNHVKHKTVTPDLLARMSRVDDLVREEFRIGTDQLVPRDRRWLSRPLQTVLAYTLEDKRLWLKSVNQSRMRWQRRRSELRQSQAASRRALRDWLTGHPPS